MIFPCPTVFINSSSTILVVNGIILDSSGTYAKISELPTSHSFYPNTNTEGRLRNTVESRKLWRSSILVYNNKSSLEDCIHEEMAL